MALKTITPAIESALITAAGQARCERDQRGAVLVTTSRDFDGSPAGTVRGVGWNGLPAGLGCTQRLCSPPDKVRSCATVAEHAEALAIRDAACLGFAPHGLDMVHAKVVDGLIVVSRPPTEKTCKTCAVLMRAWGIDGIWLFVEGRFSEPLGQWTRWSVADYYRLAAGCEVL